MEKTLCLWRGPMLFNRCHGCRGSRCSGWGLLRCDCGCGTTGGCGGSLRLFAEGVLIRPSDREANLVHLVQAIYALCGVQGLTLATPARQLMDLIGPSQNLVFILLDGLGMNLVNRLPADSFLMSHLRGQI